MRNQIESPYTDGIATLKKEQKSRSFRKEDYMVLEHFYECQDTKKQFTTEEIDEVNINQVYNAYRSNHGILFPEQIKSLREKYNLNHTDLSKILGLGVNMIRNYENGEMPSVSNATLLKLILNPVTFRDLFLQKKDLLGFRETKVQAIIDKVNQILSQEEKHHNTYIPTVYLPDEYTGYLLPNFEKLAHMTIFFLEKLDFLFKVKLNKLLFYSDFYHFKTNGKSISGNKYCAIPMGPVPDKYHHLYAMMADESFIGFQEYSFSSNDEIVEKMVPITPFNKEIFSPAECATLEFVFEQLGYKKTSEIVEISHHENCWKEQNEIKGIISYAKYGFEIQGIL